MIKTAINEIIKLLEAIELVKYNILDVEDVIRKILGVFKNKFSF